MFNVLLITRAPLQLFQAIQTSLLPHLSGLVASHGGGDEFSRSLRVTMLAIAVFAGAVVIGLAAIGPWAMGVLFGGDYDYAPRRARARRHRDGLPPHGGHAQPGGAGARPLGRRGVVLARVRGDLPRCGCC